MANENLTSAKNAKNDEFYTQYIDIEKEVSAYLEYDSNVFKEKTILLPCDDPEWSNFTKYFAQNFERFGLKKLISTSFAMESKGYQTNYQPTLFEVNNPQYDENKTITNGKIFTLDHDTTNDGRIDINDLEWKYLKGDGDFNSDEIKALRDEADIIITNPPFSKFRDFLNWIIEDKKQFLIIGNINAITYKEVFPLIKKNKIWLGVTSGAKEYLKPDGSRQKMGNTCWFTNLDHGRRHQPLSLMTEVDVIKFSTKQPFDKYDNYDAIEVSYVKNIPSDYGGVMGVPISFLDKYNPDQFEIVGMTSGRDEFECRPSKRYINPKQINKNGSVTNGSKANTRATIKLKEIPINEIYYTAENTEGPLSIVYARILIKHKR